MHHANDVIEKKRLREVKSEIVLKTNEMRRVNPMLIIKMIAAMISQGPINLEIGMPTSATNESAIDIAANGEIE